MQVEARILPHHALEAVGKRNGLKRKVADLLISEWGVERNVRFGSLADILRCLRDVRFTPKADICSALAHVR